MKKYLIILTLALLSCNGQKLVSDSNIDIEEIIESKSVALLTKADEILNIAPTPITLFTSERSMGGVHDFYSEGDYWWPDPENPDGPYIRKDGLSNPNNFLDHRMAMRNLNEWVSTLVAAYNSSGEVKYAAHALKHLQAFFLDSETKMNPNLLYAQAIKGRHTGRGIGIIDTIHLIEVAKSIQLLFQSQYLTLQNFESYQNWFDQYATWMNTHPYGLDEKDHGNNHSTWWASQMAAFASIAGREDLMDVARGQFKKLISAQMAADGSFPDELSRTKPYIYTLFNLEGYAILCEIASTADDNLWEYKGTNGAIKRAFDYMVPFMKDKTTWTMPPDVSHFDEIPIQSVGLFLAGRAFKDAEFLKVWSSLDDGKQSEEIKRNFPLWYPQNWL